MRLILAIALLLGAATGLSAQAPSQSPAMKAFLEDGRAKGYAQGAACTYNRDVAACEREIASLDSFIRLPTATRGDREHFYNLLFETYGSRTKAQLSAGAIDDAVAGSSVAYRRMIEWIGGREGEPYPTGWIIALSLQQAHAHALFAAGRHADAGRIVLASRSNAARIFNDRTIAPAYSPEAWQRTIVTRTGIYSNELVESLTRLIEAARARGGDVPAALRAEILSEFANSEHWLRLAAARGLQGQNQITALQARIYAERGHFYNRVRELGAAEVEFRTAGMLQGCTAEANYNRLNLPPRPPPPPPGQRREPEQLPTSRTCDSTALGWAESRGIGFRQASPMFLAALRANPVAVTRIVVATPG